MIPVSHAIRNMDQLACLMILLGALSTASKVNELKLSNKVDNGSLHPLHSSQPHSNTIDTNSKLSCDPIEVHNGGFLVLENGLLYVIFYKKTYDTSLYELIDGSAFVCADETDNMEGTVITSTLNCEPWTYDPGQYNILQNGSVSIGESVYTGRMKFFGNILNTCFNDHGEDYNATVEKSFMDFNNLTGRKPDSTTLVYAGNIGCGFSLISLIGYLLVFSLVKELRNLPGYNLTSLSVSLLLGYSFFLVGQIPQVLGTFCVSCAVFSQYFFLASFFWMNSISFDVWRTLWISTRKLMPGMLEGKTKRFLAYSLYSWSVPLVFILAAVIADNHPDTPSHIRPAFGRDSFCIFNEMEAKKIFFAAPGCTLFVVNTIFFCHSTYLVLTSPTGDGNCNQVPAKRNFLLYVRLGVIMGITWIVGIVASFENSEATLLIFNLMNSTQGVFVFLLFVCSPKTLQHFRRKINRNYFATYVKNSNSGTVNCSNSLNDRA